MIEHLRPVISASEKTSDMVVGELLQFLDMGSAKEVFMHVLRETSPTISEETQEAVVKESLKKYKKTGVLPLFVITYSQKKEIL